MTIRRQVPPLFQQHHVAFDTTNIFIMVRHTAQVILFLIVAQVATADSDAIRRRRRGVLEVDHQESAAEILASLWEKDGINPDQRSLAKKGGMMDGKGGKGGKGKKGKDKEDKGKGGKGGKSEDMSFYYF